jgi:hypothetical protein
MNRLTMFLVILTSVAVPATVLAVVLLPSAHS